VLKPEKNWNVSLSGSLSSRGGNKKKEKGRHDGKKKSQGDLNEPIHRGTWLAQSLEHVISGL